VSDDTVVPLVSSGSCPECGQRIGRSDHALVAGNSKNEAMEGHLRAAGALRSPWAWAQ
jgi:hypothetical protein